MAFSKIMQQVIKEKTNYREMVDFCTEGMRILNNEIISKYNEHYFDLEIFSGSEYNEETDDYVEVFQCYIITENGAEMLSKYTNEIIYYLPEFDLYLLGVTHFGTCWDGVSANWKQD